MNFKILVYYYLQEVGSKTHPFSDKQRTHEVQTHRSLKFETSLLYYKGKPLCFKAAIVTSLIDLSVLILPGGIKLVQCGILFTVYLFRTKTKYCFCNEILLIRDIKSFNADG